MMTPDTEHMWQEFLPATEQPVTDAIRVLHPGVTWLLQKYSTGVETDAYRMFYGHSSGSLSIYGIRIINISVGAAAMDSKAAARLIKAVEQAWDQGFVVVTAAGNMGPAYGSVTAPGSSKKVITVGASDMLDRISSVSGAGPTAECVCKPDLVAPGADVISCANKRNSYAIKSGTSMSTPRVSGAIALLLQKDPFLTNVEVKMLLRESCLDLGYPRNRQGWGKLDIQKLLAL